MPDFGFQNVLVDDDGTVTGLLDWDGNDTVPRQSGYARYPLWIMRDWDAFLYSYAEMADGEIELLIPLAHISRNAWPKTPYIIVMLAKHAFGREAENFLSSYDIEHAVKEAPWFKNYLVEVERHVPPSGEDRAIWKLGEN
ncbi:hypothetical protein M413DRAFT_421199 [Hebeloma cylindrosporum]|uniref:Aminoglycoside phosphotransferase domain-containing protein n=1 Tax=Hebeloma cylindrosporum TaxID=76867 RepID=A0A0C3C2R9_HEBCY|nr:hypothetical protein M413DRAFT_421199 [Hebeloma cylindrosporum h7]